MYPFVFSVYALVELDPEKVTKTNGGFFLKFIQSVDH